MAGREYQIDLRGSPTDDGTLSDPRLYGVHDAAGNLIANTANDDWGGTYNSRVTFTASESGTYYIAAGAFGSNRGTYELEVTDKSPADTGSQTDTTTQTDTSTPTDADSVRAGATDLGDITELQGPRFPRGTLDGDTDQVDYYRFTLTEAKRVGLGLRQQDADADLFLEDADGTVLYSSTSSGTTNERIEETLLAGTYYLRVESQEAGENAHVVRYGVSAPDADALAALQQQSDTATVVTTNAAPTFGQQGYTFDLAENADGSTNRVSLGTVAATDPEGATLAYSLVGASSSFEIDETSGELFYNGSGEDYESGTTQFTLTVRASDGNETADTSVTVNVTDVNESPSFVQASYAFDLAENADGSTDRVSLGTVAATDPEGVSPVYSLVGASGSFEIDETSGELFYKGSGEDYESGTTEFTLTVRASDGSETVDTTVTVNVTDVEETADPPVAEEDEESGTPQTVSEPDDEDFSADTSTVGRVVVGETATGDIGAQRDRDWFAVELVAGREYQIDLRGSPTDDGTLSDPRLYGVHDAAGNQIARTTNDDWGGTYNSRVTFTAPASGLHYIAAGAFGSNRGTYELEVTDKSPADTSSQSDTTTVVTTNAAPTFGQQGYAFDLAENADGSTDRVSLGTVAATDPEGVSPVYSLVGDSGSFEIDETSGELFYNGSGEDYESGTTQFTLTVRASDGSETADTTVTVNLTDVEETADPPVAEEDEESSSPQTVSEPDDEDFAADTSTAGKVVVGETATGDIGTQRDRDWFAVELVAGREYQIDLRGSPTDDGTLFDPRLYGVHDAAGNRIAGTANDDWGGTYNSRVTFTATDSGTHYIAAGAFGTHLGTYTLEVTDISPAPPPPASGESETPVVQEVETTETDSTPPPPSGESGTPIVRVADASATEGDDPAILFRVTLDRASTETVTVNYTTVDGTAEAGEDYQQTSGALSFAPGETEKYVQVTVIDDEVEDSGETFRLVLSDPSGGQLGDTDATGTIFNTEPAVDETASHISDLAADTSTLGRVSVNGGIASGQAGGGRIPDRDWYRVELEAGETYRIDVDGPRGHPFQYIEGIYNSGGWEIPQTSDWRSGPDNQPRLYFTPDQDGHYFIAVTLAGVEATTTRKNYQLTVVTDNPDDDYSDDTDTTGTVTVDGAAATGEVTYTRDRDWFEVALDASTTYQITLRPDSGASDQLDATYLRGIYDSNGDLLPDTWNFGAIQERFELRASNGDVSSYRQYTSRVEFTPDDTGTYYISASGHGSSTGSYELEVDTM